MAISIGNGGLSSFSLFDSAVGKINNSFNLNGTQDSQTLTDGMVELTLSKRLTQLEVKQIQTQDEMLGYILDIKK